jgi:hypothetical protein
MNRLALIEAVESVVHGAERNRVQGETGEIVDRIEGEGAALASPKEKRKADQMRCSGVSTRSN